MSDMPSRVARWLEACNRAEDAKAEADALKPAPWRATGGPGGAVFLPPCGKLHIYGVADHVAPIFVPGDARELALWILRELQGGEA